MGTDVAVKEDENSHYIAEHVVSLKHFPPKLRKLAKHLLESGPCTINEACRVLKLNQDSIHVMIWKSKKKGNDFQKFIDERASEILHRNKLGVYSALVEGAVSHTPQATSDRKLYFQLTGDLKENTVNIGTLTVGVVIQQPSQDTREKGIIDVEPMIPQAKK